MASKKNEGQKLQNLDSVCIAVTGCDCFSLLPVPEPKSHYNVLILLAIVVYVLVP